MGKYNLELSLFLNKSFFHVMFIRLYNVLRSQFDYKEILGTNTNLSELYGTHRNQESKVWVCNIYTILFNRDFYLTIVQFINDTYFRSIFFFAGNAGICKRQFSYRVVSFTCIGGENRSTREKPPTCRRSLTNFIT